MNYNNQFFFSTQVVCYSILFFQVQEKSLTFHWRLFLCQTLKKNVILFLNVKFDFNSMILYFYFLILNRLEIEIYNFFILFFIKLISVYVFISY
jgi:hypothetical protein